MRCLYVSSPVSTNFCKVTKKNHDLCISRVSYKKRGKPPEITKGAHFNSKSALLICFFWFKRKKSSSFANFKKSSARKTSTIFPKISVKFDNGEFFSFCFRYSISTKKMRNMGILLATLTKESGKGEI